MNVKRLTRRRNLRAYTVRRRVSLTRTVSLRKIGVYYTADIVRPDGSDSFDGEPCEDGYGATIEHGWYSPDWSRGDVYESHRDVSPDQYVASRDGDARRWLADRLTSRIEYVDSDHANVYGDSVSIYDASDGYTHPYTGVNTRVAAHPYGFESWEVKSALAMIRDARNAANRAATEYARRVATEYSRRGKHAA